jgi:phage protein D
MPLARFAISVDGNPLPADALGRVTTLEVSEGDDVAGRAVLRFELGQAADGSYPLIDDGPFEPAAEVRVQLAAPGGADQAVFTGLLSHLRPHFEDVEANCFLEVVVTDHALLLAAEDRVASYPDVSDSEAAEEVLARYGLTAETDETAARLGSEDVLLVQRSDDWAFLRHLARRNGFVAYFEPDPATGDPVCHFHARRLDQPPQADLTILREDDNLGWLDVQVSHDRPATRTAAGIDTLAKRLVRADAAEDEPVLGEELVVTAASRGLSRAGAQAQVRHLRGAVPRDEALNAHVAGRMARDHLAVEVRGSLDPATYRGLLRAHRPVLVKGVGDRLTGTYYVTRVVTTMEGGELHQTFTAVSNALGRSGREEFGQSAEEEEPA